MTALRPLAALAAFSLALLTGCNRPSIIPDDELALIFHDAFVVNAYVGHRSLPTDSIDYYSPLFARYGYTTEDVQATIRNFARRKSASLGDVVERAIARIEAETAGLERETAILDTIDRLARREATVTLLARDRIRVRQARDTAEAHFTLDGIRPGTYTLRFDYLIDSLDRNASVRVRMGFSRRGVHLAPSRSTFYLTRLRPSTFERSIEADSTSETLSLNLYEPAGELKRPDLRIRDLRLTYTPPADEAVEELARKRSNIKLFLHEFIRSAAPHSGAQPADSLGVR